MSGSQPEIEVYVTNYCPYCTQAKSLLDAKGVKYEVVDVTGDDDARIKLVERANGMKTVPQIFIKGEHVGGFRDLSALDEAGKLDAMLSA